MVQRQFGLRPDLDSKPAIISKSDLALALGSLAIRALTRGIGMLGMTSARDVRVLSSRDEYQYTAYDGWQMFEVRSEGAGHDQEASV